MRNEVKIIILVILYIIENPLQYQQNLYVIDLEHDETNIKSVINVFSYCENLFYDERLLQNEMLVSNSSCIL